MSIKHFDTEEEMEEFAQQIEEANFEKIRILERLEELEDELESLERERSDLEGDLQDLYDDWGEYLIP